MIAGLVLLLLGLTAAGRARAATPEEQARQLFREANQLFARKLYLDALERYRKAKALFPSYKTDLNIASTLEALGRRTEAAVYFERFLIQSAAAPADSIAAARERIDELRAKLARVKVTTLVEGATILADGVAVGTAPLDIPVYLEPGQHRLEARKEGATSSSRAISVIAGQDLAVDLSEGAIAPASRPAAAKPVIRPAASKPAISPVASTPVMVRAPAPPPPAVPDAPDPRLVKRHRARTIWAWSSLAVGGTLAIAGAILYGVGIPEGNSAYETYSKEKQGTKAAGLWSDVESAQGKVIAGHVLMGVAAVGIGVSLYCFFSRPKLAERQGPQVTFVPLATGAALHGSF